MTTKKSTPKKATKASQKPVEVETTNQDTVTPTTESNGMKTVNVPLSASNALQPEAGIQVPVDASRTHEVVKTDPYVPTDTKVVSQLNEGEELLKGSPPELPQLRAVMNEIYDRHSVDVSQRNIYNKRLGL